MLSAASFAITVSARVVNGRALHGGQARSDRQLERRINLCEFRFPDTTCFPGCRLWVYDRERWYPADEECIPAGATSDLLEATASTSGLAKKERDPP